ncbi:MAG TPA: hypothetical protein VFA03_09375 [Acetobacteraceae bacterium]|nr:hypothetical protein [Acetobacteraceae bacterium]
MADSSPFALWLEAGGAVDALVEQLRRASPASMGAVTPQIGAIAEAYLLAVAAGLRCAGEMASACAARQRELAAYLANQPGAGLELTDALRALARELGETAVRRARQFQEELLLLAERLPAPDGASAPD